MDLEKNLIYEFEGRRIDPVRRELLHQGRPVAMFPRCFDALLLFIEKRGVLLDKDFLLKSLWPHVVVDENSLAKLISELRRALGFGPKDGSCIETVARRGYRFNAQVLVHRRSVLPGTPAARPDEIHSLAVLPFSFLNPLADDECLGVGLADALIARLGKMRFTRVRPTSSIIRFATSAIDPVGAGRELNVDAVIAGGIRRAGSIVRVSVQLVSVTAEAVLWAETFDAEHAGTLELEDSIAARVAPALTLALARNERVPEGRRRTAHADAYEHFVRGRYLATKRTRETLLEATRCYEQAISIDPAFARAYGCLGESWVILGIRGAVSQSRPPREVMPKARAAAEKALDLDSSLSEAHATLGHVLFVYEWQRAEGLRELELAIDLDPGNQNARHWYGVLLAAFDRFDDAVAALHRALDIDPLSVIVNANLGFTLYRAGRLDEAIAKLRHTVAMEPTQVMSRYRLGLALEQARQYDAALIQFEAMNPSADDPLAFTAIARTRALRGEIAESRRLLADIERMRRVTYIPSSTIADVHVALGDHDKAFDELERAIDERAPAAIWLKQERRWDPLRTHPRFNALLARVEP
jgi:DNA-binding winged helix-turn-helix (wHTH) protein/tetratricopeptide (TPR) repeat protein